MTCRPRILVFLALLAVATLCGQAASAQTYIYRYEYELPEADGFTPYLENRAGPMRSEQLAAAARWPDALACLVPQERLSAAPDLTRIDWSRIRTRLDAEACLFRLFETLVTPQDGRRWLAAQGLQNIRLRHLPPQRHYVLRAYRNPYYRSQAHLGRIELCGTNDPARSGRVLVQSAQTATRVSQYLYGGETFCARYSRSGILLSTSYLVKGLGDYPPDRPKFLVPTLKKPKYVARPLYRRRLD